MVRTRKERKADNTIKLQQPDKSGPTGATLLELAQERKLFEEADRKQGTRRPKEDDDDEDAAIPPTVDRVMDAILWTTSLAMLHFTFDLLVQRQYAMEISWSQIATRTVQAFAVFFLLFYVLHPHSSSPVLLPGLPVRYQNHLRQAIFFATSICTGCYLIYITNEFGYMAILKRSPPLGCLWIWSVFELNLPLAVLSLACAVGFLIRGGYTIG
ncbi:hypothetical protein DL764_005843 [Monosporascus ibericus]|uniref:DUF7719 domain-containing protein n=1 Tax=Monosporascus ibericus TaxID=155417 RepID=A0A4Q4T782_9PEZI|nr:hypothetical protein DL764_005843 [Monosporascus ibericus]